MAAPQLLLEPSGLFAEADEVGVDAGKLRSVVTQKLRVIALRRHEDGRVLVVRGDELSLEAVHVDLVRGINPRGNFQGS